MGICKAFKLGVLNNILAYHLLPAIGTMKNTRGNGILEEIFKVSGPEETEVVLGLSLFPTHNLNFK